MGYTQIGRGRILWRGEDITQRAPHRRARAGIGWVAQEREIFPSLTVEENLVTVGDARDGRLVTCRRSTICFLGSPSAGAILAISFPAASSRCWRLRAR